MKTISLSLSSIPNDWLNSRYLDIERKKQTFDICIHSIKQTKLVIMNVWYNRFMYTFIYLNLESCCRNVQFKLPKWCDFNEAKYNCSEVNHQSYTHIYTVPLFNRIWITLMITDAQDLLVDYNFSISFEFQSVLISVFDLKYDFWSKCS